MSYLNQNTGYREDILSTRSVIKPGLYAILEPDGLVKNTVPGFTGCALTILASPKLGASFVDYLVTVEAGGENVAGFGEEGVETLIYVFSGTLTAWNTTERLTLHDGGYLYSPAGEKLYFQNEGSESVRAFLYKRRYVPTLGHEAHSVSGNVNQLSWVAYEGMEDVLVTDLLPAATNLGFDMNFHILRFRPGACHGYIETHIQEHGAYVYSGQGMYRLGDDWVAVKKGDYIFMGAYCPQAAYGVGRGEAFAYLYSKDCNRDASL